MEPWKEDSPEISRQQQAQQQAEEFIAAEQKKKRQVFWKNYFEWMDALVGAVLLTVVIFAFVGRVATVSGSSMFPTLEDGDMVLLSHLFYQPAQGDVVIVTQPQRPQEPLIKRIIATEGQQVYIDFEQGEVYVDGQLLQEPYVLEPTYEQYDISFPVTVPQGQVFVMGDNRNNSLDSRSSRVGMIDERNLVGKVYYRVAPLDEIGGID